MPAKKIIIFIVAVSLLVLSHNLYSSGNPEESSSSETEIEWWAIATGGGNEDPRGDYHRSLISEYEAMHPDVHITFESIENEEFKKRIQDVVNSGNPPDLFHSWGGYVMFEFAKKGMLRNINYYANSVLLKRINPESLKVYSYAGTYYGAPNDMGAVVMWYNKEIFEKAGVDVPETWTELLDAVSRIREAGYVPIALGGKDRWPAHFWWVYLAMRIGGVQAFNAAYGGSGSFKDETYIEAGRKFKELIKLDPFQEGYMETTYPQQAGLMADGKAAMELMGQWSAAVSRNNATTGEGLEHIGVFAFPAVEGGKGRRSDVMGGGNGYIVGKDAPDETLDFLNFILSEEAQKEQTELEGIIPVVKGMDTYLEGNAADIAKIVANAGYYQLYYDQYLPLSVGEAVNNAAAGLASGTLTPEEAAEMVDDAWQEAK